MQRRIVILIAVVIALTAIPIQSMATQTLAGLILVHVPHQTVEALRDGSEITARVGAKIRISPDGTADGTFRLRTREDGKVDIQAITGRGVFAADGTLERVEVEFMEANGELVTATATPNTTDPDCLIWDLANGESGVTPGENNFPGALSFDAPGQISVRDVRR